jgi:UDP-arabinose 4-epimerase
VSDLGSVGRNGRPVILVTGGAGYVGSHAVKALFRAGFWPVTYDDLSRGHADAVRYGDLVVGGLHERQKLRAVVDEYGPIGCLHFAAYAYVAESVSEPGRYYHNNVAGSLALLEVLVEAGLNNIVFSSSCAAYGNPDRLPISEACPKNPISPYGRSKSMVEDILVDFESAHGLKHVALRYFNACGADPEGELGERHDPEPHLLPRALMAAAGIIPHVDVFGSDYPTRDGTAVRDYVHVHDLAAAHVRALAHLQRTGRSEVFNLGSGRGYSVREVLAAVETVTGLRVPVREIPRRPGDPAELVADITKARQLLGFSVQYEEIEGIVETAWNWYRGTIGR